MLLRLIQWNSENCIDLQSYMGFTDDWSEGQESSLSQQANDDSMTVLLRLETLDLVELKAML